MFISFNSLIVLFRKMFCGAVTIYLVLIYFLNLEICL